MTTKTKNMFKALAASLLAICFFGAGFILLNSTVLAASISTEEATSTAELASSTELLTNEEISSPQPPRPNREGAELLLIEKLNSDFAIPSEQATDEDFVAPSLDVVEHTIRERIAVKVQETGAPVFYSVSPEGWDEHVDPDVILRLASDASIEGIISLSVREGTVVELSREAGTSARSPGSLPAEEAALLGAEYIWDVFGECIDGSTVEMHYTHGEMHGRPFWRGFVMPALDLLADESRYLQESHSFLIDAITGERLGISFSPRSNPIWEDNPNMFTYLEDSGIYNLDTFTEEAFLLFPSPEFEEKAKQAGKVFAQRHFNNSKVESAYFQGPTLGSERNAAGELVAISHGFGIMVTDNTGREVSLEIRIYNSEAVLTHIDVQGGEFPSHPVVNDWTGMSRSDFTEINILSH